MTIIVKNRRTQSESQGNVLSPKKNRARRKGMWAHFWVFRLDWDAGKQVRRRFHCIAEGEKGGSREGKWVEPEKIFEVNRLSFVLLAFFFSKVEVEAAGKKRVWSPPPSFFAESLELRRGSHSGAICHPYLRQRGVYVEAQWKKVFWSCFLSLERRRQEGITQTHKTNSGLLLFA